MHYCLDGGIHFTLRARNLYLAYILIGKIVFDIMDKRSVEINENLSLRTAAIVIMNENHFSPK